jgi:hypothetical protein
MVGGVETGSKSRGGLTAAADPKHSPVGQNRMPLVAKADAARDSQDTAAPDLPIGSHCLRSGLAPEAHSFFRAARRVARTVGMGSGAGELAAIDN